MNGCDAEVVQEIEADNTDWHLWQRPVFRSHGDLGLSPEYSLRIGTGRHRVSDSWFQSTLRKLTLYELLQSNDPWYSYL